MDKCNYTASRLHVLCMILARDFFEPQLSLTPTCIYQITSSKCNGSFEIQPTYDESKSTMLPTGVRHTARN